MLLPEDLNVLKRIEIAASQGLTVSELEYLGLPVRIINSLEENGNIIFLKDLIKHSENDIIGFHQIGVGGIRMIKKVLSIFSELEDKKEKWHKGSDRTNFYLKNCKPLKIALS